MEKTQRDEKESVAGEVAADDERIGIAFRWSMRVLTSLALLGIIIGLVVYLQRGSEPKINIDQKPVIGPELEPIGSSLPTVTFTDITIGAGIDFVHESGARGVKLLPETMGPGCAFFDYDQDYDIDILLVNGRPWPGDTSADHSQPTLHLYQNNGRGTFRDVTKEVGLEVSVYGMGVAVGDYDNDGSPDVFVSTVGTNRMFQNTAGQFREVTEAAGVGGADDSWSTSAGFFDADNDGDLDLLVCNYVRWSREIDISINNQLVGVGRAYGPPHDYAGSQPYYYRNNGDSTFTESAADVGLHVTNEATGEAVAKALGLLPIDVDRDGWIDLVVSNDTVRNFFFHNQGDGQFEELGDIAGLAYDNRGAATGAMGIDGVDYRGDGSLGIGVGNFATEMSSLYVATDPASLLFTDEAIADGIGPVSRRMLSFGLFFFDYDLDGRLDLFQTNGHLEEEINKVQPSQHYRQSSQLFWNAGSEAKAVFVPTDSKTVGDLSREVVGRAAAYGDIDGDGDLDVLITQTGDRALLLRNDQNLEHGWIRLRLTGKKTNRDAVGVWVEVKAGERMQRRQVMPTRSYLSQVEPTLTFGLGPRSQADSVRIFWPQADAPQELGPVPRGTVRTVVEP